MWLFKFLFNILYLDILLWWILLCAIWRDTLIDIMRKCTVCENSGYAASDKDELKKHIDGVHENIWNFEQCSTSSHAFFKWSFSVWLRVPTFLTDMGTNVLMQFINVPFQIILNKSLLTFCIDMHTPTLFLYLHCCPIDMVSWAEY